MLKIGYVQRYKNRLKVLESIIKFYFHLVPDDNRIVLKKLNEWKLYRYENIKIISQN